jgi:hypothetical protein
MRLCGYFLVVVTSKPTSPFTGTGNVVFFLRHSYPWHLQLVQSTTNGTIWNDLLTELLPVIDDATGSVLKPLCDDDCYRDKTTG